jgi:hypothetical protein
MTEWMNEVRRWKHGEHSAVRIENGKVRKR